MTAIIVTEEAKLRAIIQEEVAKAIPEIHNPQEEIDTITLTKALTLLSEHGYPISKARLYKLTATEKVPCRKFGQKLVFSRKDLLAWAENQTKQKGDHSEVLLNVARSARRKR